MLSSMLSRHSSHPHTGPHRTGFVFDEHFLAHDAGVQNSVEMRHGTFELSPDFHPSSVHITHRTKQFLDGSGLTAMMTPLAARPATEDELAAYHTRDYIAAMRTLVGSGPHSGAWGKIDPETVLSPGS